MCAKLNLLTYAHAHKKRSVCEYGVFGSMCVCVCVCVCKINVFIHVDVYVSVRIDATRCLGAVSV